MKTTFSIILFTLFLFLGCKKQKDAFPVNNKLNFKIIDSDSLVSSEFILSYPFTVNLYNENKQSFIIGSDNYSNKLEIINLSNKEISIFDFHSPNFLKDKIIADDFYMHAMDSIFILSAENNKIMLIDSLGYVNTTINLNSASNDFQGDSFFSISFESRRNIVFNEKKNQLVLRSIPPLDWHTSSEFYNKPIFSIFDIKKNKFIKSFGKFPEHYSEGNLYFPSDNQFSFYLNFEENFYIISHRREHYLYKYNLITDELIKKIPVKSNFLNSFDLIPRTVDVQKMMNSLTKDGSYTNFLYNENKKQYYRIVTHNQDLKNPTNGKLNHSINNRSFSIIVLDENLDVIGEAFFENAPFHYLHLVPHKDGILTFYKDEINEDINHFHIFDFEY